MKTLTEQVKEAEQVYQEARARFPRAGRTARLLWQLQKLRTKQIAEEVRQERRAKVA